MTSLKDTIIDALEGDPVRDVVAFVVRCLAAGAAVAIATAIVVLTLRAMAVIP